MNGGKYNNLIFNGFTCCEIAYCNNKASKIIDVELSDHQTDSVYLCRNCKKSW